MTAEKVVNAAKDLSREWLSQVLGRDVRSASVAPIGAGQTSSTYRVSVDADGLPATLVAKIAEGPHETRRRVATAHRNEVGFYRVLASTVDVRVPRCWYAAISDDAASFTLLLEDLAPRFPGRQVDGASASAASAAVINLALLHSSRWCDPTLGQIDFLVPLTDDRARFLADLTREATDRFVERYAARLDDADAGTLRQVSEALYDWQVRRRSPWSVVHGDYRLDNLMLDPGGDSVVVVDWQTVTVALAGRDLGYFVGTGLPTERRRAEEDGLVEAYYGQLLGRGVEGYAAADCYSDYRRGLLHGPMTAVLGSMTSAGSRSPDADDMFVSMATRSCAAIRDQRSLEVV